MKTSEMYSLLFNRKIKEKGEDNEEANKGHIRFHKTDSLTYFCRRAVDMYLFLELVSWQLNRIEGETDRVHNDTQGPYQGCTTPAGADTLTLSVFYIYISHTS